MNTYFLTDSPEETAHLLDRQRLGKQRLEAIQILRRNLGEAAGPGWRNHPIVLAWRPYLGYLARCYLPAMLREWEKRGYRNERTLAWQERLSSLAPAQVKKPEWITPELIRAHRSYLKRRAPAYYGSWWPDIPPDLPLIWPKVNLSSDRLPHAG